MFTFFHRKKKAGAAPFHPQQTPTYPEPISLEALRRVFSDCVDFESRQISPGGQRALTVSLCFVDGLVGIDTIGQIVLRPLTEVLRLGSVQSEADCLEAICAGAVYGSTLRLRDTMDDLVSDLTGGYCAIVFDGLHKAVSFEAKTPLQRGVTVPTVEKSVKGAKDAFVENIRINTSLIRRKIHDPALKNQQMVVGRKSRTAVAVLYLEGVANSATVAEAKRRIQAMDIDGLISAASLEEYIVDAPRSLFPQLIHTERADKFAAELLAGRVGLIADGLPLGFLLPCTFAEFLHVPEDNAQPYIIASCISVLRHIALLITILLPALYVAVAMYHQEMIPVKLLFSVIESKQQVPFSTAMEIIGMLIAFELLQEAGLRLPESIGQTVSIIGALIVGQSAVEAKVISPIAVIVVAMAGICGYTIPSQDLGAALRITRFLLVVAAVLAGMFGVIAGIILFVYHLSTLDSFGTPFLSPQSDSGLLAALRSLIRPPMWADKFRAANLRTPDKRKQK